MNHVESSDDDNGLNYRLLGQFLRGIGPGSPEIWDSLNGDPDYWDLQAHSQHRLRPNNAPQGLSSYRLLQSAELAGHLAPNADNVFELLTELLIQASRILEEGQSGDIPNEELRFEDRFLDPLANPLQVRIKYPAKKYYSPQLSDCCLELAESLIKFRQTGSTQKALEYISNLGGIYAQDFLEDYSETIQSLVVAIAELQNDKIFGHILWRNLYHSIKSEYTALNKAHSRLCEQVKKNSRKSRKHHKHVPKKNSKIN